MSDNAQSTENAHAQPVYVWDLPTRLFHWSLVIAVATSLFTSEFGPMDLHMISGHVVLALLLFRLVWGIAGGRHARFASFVRGPSAVIAYARGMMSGKTSAHLGHNPMGGWSVLAIITLLAVQVATGLYANDDILTEGPLASTVSKSTSDFMTYIHHLASNGVYALIGLHLAAVAFYTSKGHKIIRAMVSGRTTDVGGDDAGENTGASGSLVLALVSIAVAGAIAYWVLNF